MKNQIKQIPNDVQDRNSQAWLKLCEYINLLAESGEEEFTPREALGDDLFSKIYTLPESISKLKKVTKISLYGSNLKRIPPEIGEMESLEYFDLYTSYDLNWLPFEITKCQKLKSSRVSTRALYGNYKHRKPFPKLDHNPVRSHSETIHCSVCGKQMTHIETEQYWISLDIATDVVPLLVNVCSENCKSKLPKPPKNYISYPHNGGTEQEQPLDENQMWEEMEAKGDELESDNGTEEQKPVKEKGLKNLKPLKLIRKIWEK